MSYTGEDAAQKFGEMLEKDVREITNIEKKEMIFGEEEREQFNDATKCLICNTLFFRGDTKVRDHCILLAGFGVQPIEYVT